MYFTGPHGMEMPRQSLRLAGAQIPVGTNIQANKREILKALDWAKENEVDHLLTPEASLSGYLNGWENDIDEIKDALKEIEEHQKKCNLYLHLGTNFEENESKGTIRRNEVRHYNKNGHIIGATFKTFVLNDMEHALGRVENDPITVIELTDRTENQYYVPSAATLICNDLFGHSEAGEKPLVDKISKMNLDLMFHSTNGRKMELDDPQMIVFDSWHDAHLRMASNHTYIPILTVDSCTDWRWDGDEEEVTHYHTSSQSGFIDPHGWQTDVPRVGRQYFYYDHDVTYSPMERYQMMLMQREQEQNSGDSV